MESNGKYLNEEWYQKTKKKITRVSLIIFILSVVIGGILIALGVIKTKSSESEAKQINEQRYNEAYKKSEEKYATAETRLKEISEEKENISKEYDQKKQECDSLNMGEDNWFANKNQCDREASAIRQKIINLESEEFNLKNADYTVYYDIVHPKKFSFLSIIGVMVIVMGSFIALIVYVVSKRREITAFTAQQVMPVAQEGIEQMAPTIGNAVGEIAKGIKNGLEDADKK